MSWRSLCGRALAGLALLGGCGGSPSDGGSSPPVYHASTPGWIRQVTFIDDTHFSWNRAQCISRETGCTETGTYAITGDSITFTIPQVDVTFGYGQGYSVTLPFSPNVSTGATGETGEALHPEGAELTTGSTGSLTSGTSLGSSIQVGDQTFASGPTPAPLATPQADGGVALTTPVLDTWLPQVVDQQGTLVGGAVISPTVITVTWSADKNASYFETFDDALSGSAYWTATTHEYGVGPLTSGAAQHVRLRTKPPTTLTAENISTWIGQQLSAKRLPAPTANSFYAFYLTTTSSNALKMNGQKVCGTYGGYHTAMTAKGVSFAYAIMVQCPGDSLNDTTTSASHELVEGSADPFDSKPAYIGFDNNHLAWDVLQDFQDEIGDACEFFLDINTNFTANGHSFQVQRTWSDLAAAQGHDPCVPAPSGAYFNMSPQGMTNITITTPQSDYVSPTGGATPKTLSGLGYSVKVGQTQKISLGFVSDTPATSWSIAAYEGSPPKSGFNVPAVANSKSLTLSLDKTSGKSGDIATLTVKVKSANAKLGAELVVIASTANGLTHYAPLLIANK